METYQVTPLCPHPQIQVSVPGSKSITNRALLMASMAQGETVLDGVLFSDDSRHFLQALLDLGFQVQIEEEKNQVRVQGLGGRIPRADATIYVGSAGTAARFLTAFIAMSDQCCRIDASEQMKKRPMAELIQVLRQMGAQIVCLEEADTFPMSVTGIGHPISTPTRVDLNIDRSSQFLSALLMCAPLVFEDLTIHLTGQRSARAYVEMTEQMMQQFGHPGVKRLSENEYQVCAGEFVAGMYEIEPDVSAACYYYGMAAITGGRACVARMRADSLQGDMQFLQVLERMGCRLCWQEGQLLLTGPEPGQLSGVDVDLSDCSDQALTLAAIAPFANSPVRIRNIGHIRGQECDRIHAIVENLGRMQVGCEETADGVTIYPSRPVPAQVECYSDHRVAMAFAMLGAAADGIVIDDPACCAKTFETYFQVYEQVLKDNQV